MANYTVTFAKGRNIDELLPLYMSTLSDTKLSVSEILNLYLHKECKIVEIKLDKSITGFNAIELHGDKEQGLKVPVTTLTYVFNINTLNNYLPNADLKTELEESIEKEIWRRSKEIMTLFNIKEMAFDSGANENELVSNFVVSQSIWIEAGRLNIYMDHIRGSELGTLKIETILMTVKRMTVILKKVMASVISELRLIPHYF